MVTTLAQILILLDFIHHKKNIIHWSDEQFKS